MTKHLTRVQALTLVELLVASAVVGAILAIVGAFFVTQARVTRDVQDRNELNMRLRAVGEGIAQDLQMAGARAVVVANVPEYVSDVPEVGGSCAEAHVVCEDVSHTPLTPPVVLSVVYASSLWPQIAATSSCRWVVYRLDAASGDLFRQDLPCPVGGGAPPFGDLDPTSFASRFATDIMSVDITYACVAESAEVSPRSDPAACYAEGRGGVRAATVSLVANGRRVGGRSELFELTVTMPNTREGL